MNIEQLNCQFSNEVICRNIFEVAKGLRAIAVTGPFLELFSNTDRGVLYASTNYVKELEFYGFKISMSGKGNPYDDAYAESLIKTIKSEEVHLWEYRTVEDVQRRFQHFIDEVYNQKRLHSSLGYRQPCEYEALFLN